MKKDRDYGDEQWPKALEQGKGILRSRLRGCVRSAFGSADQAAPDDYYAGGERGGLDADGSAHHAADNGSLTSPNEG